MAKHEFKALSAGTLSNPYRYVEKDEIVLLDDSEAKFYAKKSKWLRPLAEVKNRVEPPLMSHMAVKRGMDGLPYARPQPFPPSPQTPGYDEAMKRIVAAEKAADTKVQEPGEGAEPEGTGNADPLA